MTTLWDLLPFAKPKPRSKPKPRPRPARRPPPPTAVRTRDASRRRYDQIARECLAHYDVRVRKWRTSMSGVAWQVEYADGRVARLIEAPRPRGPMSAAIFLHEIGHHAIGFNVYKPRCLEEYMAWAWALERMRELGINVTERVEARMHESLHYAIYKARKRGLKRLPAELIPYMAPPPRFRRRARAG